MYGSLLPADSYVQAQVRTMKEKEPAAPHMVVSFRNTQRAALFTSELRLAADMLCIGFANVVDNRKCRKED